MRAGWLVLVFSQWWRLLWTISVWYSLSFVWSCQQTEGNFHLSSHLFFFWFLPQYLATQNTPTTTKTCRPCVTTSHPGSIQIGGLPGPGYFPESTRPSPDCQKCRPPVQCSFPWVGRCNEKCEKLKTFLHNFSPLREVQGRAPPGAPAGVLVEPLHLLRPTPPSRQQRRGGRQQLHHGSSSPVRNGPGNPGVNTLTLLQAEILRVTLKLCNGTLFPKKILIISYECQDSPGHSPPRRGPPPSPHCPPGWRTRAGRSRCPGGCRHCRSPLCRWRGRRRADHWSPLSGRNLTDSVSSLCLTGGEVTHCRSSNTAGPQRISRRCPKPLRRSGAPPWRTWGNSRTRHRRTDHSHSRRGAGGTAGHNSYNSHSGSHWPASPTVNFPSAIRRLQRQASVFWRRRERERRLRAEMKEFMTGVVRSALHRGCRLTVITRNCIRPALELWSCSSLCLP